MPQEKDKKIKFKILTSDYLLEKEEEQTEAKEILPKAGGILPQIEETVLKREEASVKKEVPPIEEKTAELEVFRPQIKPKVFKEKKEEPSIPSEREKKLTRKSNYLKYLLIIAGIFVFALGIVFLKPFERPLSKKEQSPTTTIVTLPQETTTLISLPEVATMTIITSTYKEIEEKTLKKEEPIVSEKKAEEKFTQPTFIFPGQEFSFINYFPQKEIKLFQLDFSSFEKAINSLLVKQEMAGSMFYLNFSFGGRKAPFNFIFDYFLKPTKISQEKLEKFKEEFTGNYAFMLYYSYTRKYPLLIFEIKNPQTVKLFNQLWEKENMINDLKTLFFDLNPGKPLRNYFVTKEIQGLPYRIVYFDNNYKLIWAITSNYLIYSSTEKGLEKIVQVITQ